MARGMGRTGSARPVFSELQQNGDPPQSTLAAQLVNHFTDGKKYSKNKDDETFRQLLCEVLGAESTRDSQSHNHETDNDVNYKLVYVIVKAGLETLTDGDPFSEQAEKCQQAIDSLTAVEYTLKRSPEILFILSPNNEFSSRFGIPLFLWLIPKLLAVAGSAQNSSVKDCVLNVLRTIIVLEQENHVKGARIFSIGKYLNGCVRGLHAKLYQSSTANDPTDFLTYLEASAPGKIGSCGSLLQPVVPSTTTISRVYPEYSQNNNPLDSLQVLPKDRGHAVSMTMCLLALSASISPRTRDAVRTINASSEHGRVLNDLTRFWHCVASGGVRLDHNEALVTSLVLLLTCLRSFCIHLTATSCQTAPLLRFCILISQITTTIISNQPLPLASSIETALCLNLIEVAFLTRKFQHLRQRLANDVLPTLIRTNRPDGFDSFSQDLQVRYGN